MLKVLWALLLLVLGLSAFDFARRMQTSDTGSGEAVVFTGQFDRVRLGLRLLEEGKVDRLFISGVNAGAGINPEGFAEQFALSPRLRSAMNEGRLVIGTRANTTMENALETACWYRQTGLVGSLILVTESAHLPRASLALEGSLPGVEVQRLTVDSDIPPFAALGLEFTKYLATRAEMWMRSFTEFVRLRGSQSALECPAG